MRPSNVHLDILMGRDTLIGPADVFLGSYIILVNLPQQLITILFRIRLCRTIRPSQRIREEIQQLK